MNTPPDTHAPAHPVPRLIRPFRHPCGSVHRLVRNMIECGLILVHGMCACVTWLIEHPWANKTLMLLWALVFTKGTMIVQEAFPPQFGWSQLIARLPFITYLVAGALSVVLHCGR